jgi:hypothetical protein
MNISKIEITRARGRGKLFSGFTNTKESGIK